MFDILNTEPIPYWNHDELLTRDDARGRLNLPEDVAVTYVQLGAGQINDINSEIKNDN